MLVSRQRLHSQPDMRDRDACKSKLAPSKGVVRHSECHKTGLAQLIDCSMMSCVGCLAVHAWRPVLQQHTAERGSH
jgi:hypothetical protein